MDKSFLKLFIFVSILCIAFTSCVKDDYWVTANFDYSMEPAIETNGYFKITNKVYLSDINRICGIYPNIEDIEAKNSWIQLETDDYYGFKMADQIHVDRIVINGQSLDLDYSVHVDSSLAGNQKISFENDRVYSDYIYNALKMLSRSNYIEITVYGYSSMYSGNLYIVLANNLELLVDNSK